MKYVFLTLLMIGVSGVSQGEITHCDKYSHEGWNSSLGFDDFEGQSETSLSTSVFDKSGKTIGSITFSNIGQFSNPAAWIRLSMARFDPTWPACDYEYAKYKVDDSDSDYFGTAGHACPVLVASSNFIRKLQSGNKLYVSVNSTTGVIDLKGFTHIYNKTLSAVKKKQCISK